MKIFITILTTVLIGFASVSPSIAQVDGNEQALIGSWSYSGGSVEFNSDGTGQMLLKNMNRNAPCPEGSVTKYSWSVSGEKLILEYTSMFICGERQPTPEPDAPKSFSIQGNTLNWAGITWVRS